MRNSALERLRPKTWLPAAWGMWALLTLSGLAAVASADDQVVIEQLPVVVEHRTYDPEHPTDVMPAITPPEIGLCISEFGCEMKMSTATPRGRPADTKIESIRMVTRLKITIWTRVLAPEREVNHEEAHRAISEAYYRMAATIARQLASDVINRRLFRLVRQRRLRPAPGGDGIQAASDALQSHLLEEYLAQTHWRCAFAQECFDQITDHGRNDVAEAEGVARAIAEESAHAQAKRKR